MEARLRGSHIAVHRPVRRSLDSISTEVDCSFSQEIYHLQSKQRIMGLTETVICPHCESTLEYHEIDWHTSEADEAAEGAPVNGVIACQKCQKVLGVRNS